MKKLSPLERKIIMLPLEYLFVYFAVLFGVLSYLEGVFMNHLDSSFALTLAVVEAIIFGLLMTWFAAYRKKKFMTLYKASEYEENFITLSNSIRTQEIPSDARLKAIFPKYIQTQTSTYTRNRMVYAIAFPVMFAASIALFFFEKSLLSIIGMVAFAALFVISLVLTNKHLKRLTSLNEIVLAQNKK